MGFSLCGGEGGFHGLPSWCLYLLVTCVRIPFLCSHVFLFLKNVNLHFAEQYPQLSAEGPQSGMPHELSCVKMLNSIFMLS